ncbi:MAG: isopentenyl-diphosphate delta-isomerase [Saprospiraceae bacterium]|nr:isopentenyl-diphosphate delta-isomerase [Saprospiraceae bacterium]
MLLHSNEHQKDTVVRDTSFEDDDSTSVSRKKDHIELAFQSQIDGNNLDKRFYYEPLLSGHPSSELRKDFQFLGKTVSAPLWVSSMTGGTALARKINHSLARVANEFGFGMGLGSCRSLLTDRTYFDDFNIRPIIGDDLPLYANLGIAQIEQLIENNQLHLISNLLDSLQADGLIIHVNPMQEWLQPEGDHFAKPPIETIYTILDKLPQHKYIVKEVGQGMGRESLKTLFQLPIEAVDFAANGGTNFAKLELLRSTAMRKQIYAALANVGHSATEMTLMTNEIIEELGNKAKCQTVIISGGVKNFLDGYYLINKSKLNAVYGQASSFLKHARGSYEDLYNYVKAQIEGLRVAECFLKVR